MPNRPTLFRLALVAITLIAHAAVCTHDFINMDDPQTISDNPRLKPPSLANIAYYWHNRGLELYVPCTYTAWSLMAAISAHRTGSAYVLHPSGFHLLNLCCHILSVLIVFQILQLLALSPEYATLGAALFAVHPLQVESVAWATALKDCLSGVAALFAIWQYLRAISIPLSLVEKPRFTIRPYLLATIAFAIATLSKPGAVAAVGIAAVLDFYVSPSTLLQIARRLSPWLAISLAVTLIAHHVQPAGDVADNPLLLRPLIALDAIGFYLWKLCWPINLCPDYGRRPTLVIARGYLAWTWAIPLAAAVFAGSMRKREPLVLIGAAIFFAALLPSLGFIPFIYQRNSTVADRYTYLALLGPAIVLACCAHRFARARIAAILAILVLVLCTIRQETLWKSSLILFANAVQISPEAPFNHLNYGVALASDGQLDAAEKQFQHTLALSPHDTGARDDLALVDHLIAAHAGGRP